VATKREVEARLRELISRLARAEGVQGSLAESLPDRRILAVSVPDLDAEYWTVMSAGRMDPLRTGRPEQRADIRIRVDSDHLVELVDGERSLFSSVMAGHVRIDASVSDLLRLRRLA
jgi:hypothetical protein